MAISYPLTPPSSGHLQIVWQAEDAVGMSVSPYTYSQELYRHPGQRLECQVQFVPQKRDDAAEWIAFLLSLRGRFGTFYLSPPAEGTGRGALSGTPVVKGAGQTGGTILIDGCGNNVTNWIKKQSWVQFGSGASSRLHMSLTDASSNGSGEVTLELWPDLRTAPGDNEAIVVSNPKGVFRLAENQRGWSLGLAQIYGLGFSAVEAL